MEAGAVQEYAAIPSSSCIPWRRQRRWKPQEGRTGDRLSRRGRAKQRRRRRKRDLSMEEDLSSLVRTAEEHDWKTGGCPSRGGGGRWLLVARIRAFKSGYGESSLFHRKRRLRFGQSCSSYFWCLFSLCGNLLIEYFVFRTTLAKLNRQIRRFTIIYYFHRGIFSPPIMSNNSIFKKESNAVKPSH